MSKLDASCAILCQQKPENPEEVVRGKTPPPGSRSPQRTGAAPPPAGEGADQRLVKKLMREGWAEVPSRCASVLVHGPHAWPGLMRHALLCLAGRPFSTQAPTLPPRATG
jgi:hypothetical protein